LGGGEVGLGLGKLLVQLGRLDDGEQIALAHMRSDVVRPGFDVARGARVDGGQREGLHVAGKHNLAGVLLKDRLRQRDRRSGIGIGGLHQFGIGMNAAHDAGGGSNDGYDEDDEGQR
jgi:hypothetical protein